MVDRLIADGVVVFHLAFIGFAFAGGLLVLRWRRLMALHLPAVAWATLVEVMHWHCPLTPLENYFRHRGGQAGYSEGFVEHYLEPILYPSGLTPSIQVMIGCAVFLVNAAVYAVVITRWRRGRVAARGAASALGPRPDAAGLVSTPPAAHGSAGQWV
jgi:hypothetical protein